MRCLHLLVASRAPIGGRELADLLQMEQTRANRLLGTLASTGMAEKTADRKYRAGAGVHVLAALSLHGSPLLSCALPHLEALRTPGRTVALGLLWQQHVCFLYHARPETRREHALGRHELVPAGLSSTGIILLAVREDRADVDALVRHLGNHPEAVREPLAKAVAAARRDHFARLTFLNGDISLAVPIGNPVIASLALAGKMTEKEISSTVKLLREVAVKIGEDLALVSRSLEPSPLPPPPLLHI